VPIGVQAAFWITFVHFHISTANVERRKFCSPPTGRQIFTLQIFIAHYGLPVPRRLLGILNWRVSVAPTYVLGGIFVFCALVGVADGAIAACNVQLHITNSCLGNFKLATGGGSDLLKTTEELIGTDVKIGICSSNEQAEITRASWDAGEKVLQLSRSGQLKSTSEAQNSCLNSARNYSN
jgi:hypothetical protein